MGSIHHITRYLPNLAQTAAALRPLLKNTEKNKLTDWKPEHNTTFDSIIKLVSEMKQNKFFDQKLNMRVVCDAYRSSLGAEQEFREDWVGITYSSRFLNSLKEKQSVNKLELLGLVWAFDHFKY